MKKIIVTSVFLLIYSSLSAQNGFIGIGTTSPEAVLDVVSSKNGILIPRATATQVQAIQNPDESELVYSITNDGITINKKGFWFYQSGSWKPLLENISNNNNIYTNDGVLDSERQMTMDGKSLNIGPNLFYISGTSSSIGILTASPTQALDVNGDARIQGLNNNPGNVIADAQGVLIHDTTDYFDIGDVKPSFMATDHDGWYLLDGRNISTLSTTAQNNATTVLGITTALPNAAGRHSMGAAATPGSFQGNSANNTVTLVRNNLPSFNFTYTTDNKAHTHTMTFDRIQTNTVYTSWNNVHDSWLGGAFDPAPAGIDFYSPRNTGSHSHSHTYTVSSGGTATAVNISPSALNANYFVYLGI